MNDRTRRTGTAAVAGGTLLLASVAAELLWSAQRPDGSVANPPLFTGYLVAWTAGAVALAVALTGLRCRSRAGQAGRWIGLAGAALLVAFGVVGLGSALVVGTPVEEAFLLFALGLLLLAVGAVPLALGLRGEGRPAAVWIAPLVAAAGALVALLAAADPWHDLGLFLFDAAWIVLGVRLRTGTRSAAASVPAAG